MSRLESATAECLVEFRRLSNDLFADFRCHCRGFVRIPNGYADHYFFAHVSAKDRTVKCDRCGRNYLYRWTPEGVLIAKVAA